MGKKARPGAPATEPKRKESVATGGVPDPFTHNREATMTKDRFSQMNDILDECVADVKKRMDTITLSRKRVDKGGPTNFSPAQIGAIAAEAIRQRQALIDKAAEAAVVGQIVSG